MFNAPKLTSIWSQCSRRPLKSSENLLFSLRLRWKSDFLQESVIPTMHFQKSLPRLAVPKLEDTIQRYLMAQKPLLNPDQYASTKDIAENFLGYEGRSLHAELVKSDTENKHTSYISAPWYDMYLKYRESIVLNHNPFILTKDDPNTDDQAVRAAKLIHNALRFKKSLDAGVLEPDVFHLNPKKSDTDLFRSLSKFSPELFSWYVAYMFNAYPLDMSQYDRLFNTTRIPKAIKDELKTVKDGRQILVIRNGHLFLFDAVNTDGSVVSRDDIHANLSEILLKSNTPAEYPVAVLTSENRDSWASIREHLETDPSNADLLHKLDSALFGVFLDDAECKNEQDATELFLYGGDGSSRWFDKSFHMAISKDAKMAINFEHSWGDGVAVMRFLNETIKSSEEDTFVPSGATGAITVHSLNFALDSKSKNAISVAQETHIGRTQKLELSAKRMEGFGRKHLKPNKLSPDLVIQLAFQMAYYRQNGLFVPTYESCSTSAFKHGRTETLRPCTVATVACAEAFEPTHNSGPEDMLHLIKEASTMHSNLTKEAVMGQGFDRHLFALRYLADAASSNEKIEFFQDQAYKDINTIILSTSTVFSDNIQMGGFAPVTPNGFGISYLVHEEWMGWNVTAYPGSPSVSEFVGLVETSLEDIQSVLNGKNFKFSS